jgi:protein transport protein SEC24
MPQLQPLQGSPAYPEMPHMRGGAQMMPASPAMQQHPQFGAGGAGVTGGIPGALPQPQAGPPPMGQPGFGSNQPHPGQMMAGGPPGSMMHGPPGHQYPGAMMGHQQQQRKLDASAMPSAVQVIEDDRNSKSGLFQTGYPRAEQPPLVTTEFYCEDQGNCNPRFMRSTLYSFPANQDLVKQCAIPMALAVNAMAELHPAEHPLPIVDFGPVGPVRCHRCKAYMSPFMEFFDGGRRFKCPFCNSNSEVPNEYFAHLDHTGRRTDTYARPELFRGSYEVVATKEYCKNGIIPKPPVFIFMLDVSYNAIRTGVVTLFCQQIKHMLKDLPKDPGMEESAIEVGFVTYDQTLHFYNLKSTVGQPQMLVVGDVQDVFVPLVEGFFINPSQAEDALDSLLQQIPEVFGESRVTEIVLGPVIQAGIDALKSADRSGKLFIFHSSLPIYDAPGKLANRDDRKLLGTDKEKSILLPAKGSGEFYDKQAEDCIAVGCSADIFLFPNAFVDVATIGRFCSTSGGQLYKYQYFQAVVDGERFLKDLHRDISKPIVFDAIMRVRTSTGIRPTGFYGNFYMSNTTDIELGTTDCDKCVTVELKHDDKLDENAGAYIQAALLFTSVSGQRRLRIHNLALTVAMDLPSVYRTADLDTVINFLLKDGERALLTKGAQEMRGQIISRSAQILATYRAKCSQPSSPGQLILPEGMKLLPLYINSILKHDAIAGGQEINTDDRAWLMQAILPMRVQDTVAFLYPRLIPLLSDDAATGSGAVSASDFPVSLRCSYENMVSDGAYLLENGYVMFIWLGASLSGQWVQEVFGVNSVGEVDPEQHHLPELTNDTSKKIRGWIQQAQSERPLFMKLYIIRQTDKLEPWLRHFLVEDQGAGTGRGIAPSYVDFLIYMHKEIKEFLD